MNYMDIDLQLPPELKAATLNMVTAAIDSAVKEVTNKNSFPPFLTQQEACKYLHIAPSTFNKWDREYHIPVIKIEGVKRYKRDSLDKFMKQLEK